MPYRISVVTARFSISGVPLAQIRFARALAEAGHEVDLVFGHVGAGLVVPELAGVRRVVLGTPQVRRIVAPFRRYLRARRPDIVFAAEDHLTAAVLVAAILARSTAKISGSSRVTPFDTYSRVPLSKRWWLKRLMRAVAWRADALTCVSEDMVLQYRRVFGDARHVCVYNIVDDPASRARAREPLDDPWVTGRAVPLVVAAGSLEHWKGFDDLIAAVALLRDRARDVRLLILGEGSERAALEAQVAALGLGDRVRLPGHAPNPLQYFAHANVFALSSRVEGMPNVLVEAMLCGCTVVAADCPTGPRELLEGGRFGYLVAPRSPDALADGIAAALDAPIPPERTAEAVARFAPAPVIRRHFETLGLAA